MMSLGRCSRAQEQKSTAWYCSIHITIRLLLTWPLPRILTARRLMLAHQYSKSEVVLVPAWQGNLVRTYRKHSRCEIFLEMDNQPLLCLENWWAKMLNRKRWAQTEIRTIWKRMKTRVMLRTCTLKCLEIIRRRIPGLGIVTRFHQYPSSLTFSTISTCRTLTTTTRASANSAGNLTNSSSLSW